MAISKAKAVSAINKRGVLLVYPLQNRKEPLSLWSELFPRTKMRWEWDEDGDSRVTDLWHMRARLSTSREVVYAKWFQNRATFFSKEVFIHMLAFLRNEAPLPRESAQLYEVLEMDSSLSTKQLKEATELQGRYLESTYERAMKVLWRRLWIVGFGEVEDSSFPSLAIGATRLMFEELWEESMLIGAKEAADMLEEKLGPQNPFWRFAQKIQRVDFQKQTQRV
jgi:hypothetical protein